ncbi:MAG: replication restart helicase PriA [Bacillota bacterium]
MDEGLLAEVMVEVAVRSLDRGFHYAVPDRLAARIRVGSRVLVPFSRRQVAGYVTGLAAPGGILPAGVEIKEIKEILDDGPVFTNSQLDLARWMADYCLCPSVSALQCVIWPRIQGTGPKKVKGLYAVNPPGAPPAFDRKAAKRQVVWQTALEQPGMSRKELALAAGASVSLVDRLVSDGLLHYGDVELRRNPYPSGGLADRGGLAPTGEQAAALEEIINSIERSKRSVYLLHGITSSGKTEVYMRAISRALALGRQAVVMVPEISLTPQMVSVFKVRFGDRVAVLHSRLSEGERYDEWSRIARGEAPVVLGARSAAFAPLDRLGLIILDEEHETSYKQDETPRYHARDVALKLAGQFEAVAVLGSATPSVESYHRAQQGGPYKLLTLTQRVGMRPLPGVHIIDMREEIKEGNTGIFSSRLTLAVGERLKRREQAILFLNRRGYATFVVCRECGLVMKCPHCDISLTYHTGGHLRCHYCNHTVTAPGRCSDCGSKHVGYFGTGTQRVEEEVVRLFPGARVLRMDSDTTTRKGSHGKILNVFREGGADILIGTQMVAKGLDMPGVTLVGVVNADLTLHMPDFRSAERTFQLVAQVAGRAGRGDLGGEVMVQTMSPGHYSIVHAAAHDYTGFYSQEMKIRRALKYPPFSRLARVLLTGVDEEVVRAGAERWVSQLSGATQRQAGPDEFDIMGPAPAPLARIRDRYRYHIIVRSRSGNRLRELLRPVIERAEPRGKAGCSVAVDIDPQSLM